MACACRPHDFADLAVTRAETSDRGVSESPVSRRSENAGCRTDPERRRYRRLPAAMEATAVCFNRISPPGGRAVVQVNVVDISEGGLGGTIGELLAPPEEVVLYLPPTGGRGGRHVRGSVVRCEQVDRGYRIGVAFSDQPAGGGRRLQ